MKNARVPPHSFGQSTDEREGNEGEKVVSFLRYLRPVPRPSRLVDPVPPHPAPRDLVTSEGRERNALAVESTFFQLSAPPSTSSTSFLARYVRSMYRFESGYSYGQVWQPNLLPLVPSTSPSWLAQ